MESERTDSEERMLNIEKIVRELKGSLH